jgi:hypothetical protein
LQVLGSGTWRWQRRNTNDCNPKLSCDTRWGSTPQLDLVFSVGPTKGCEEIERERRQLLDP